MSSDYDDRRGMMGDALQEQTIAFHGHLCPGLSLGIRMAERAMERLGVARAYDEELVTIVEMDNCAVDAIQYITGCTFGKGNLVFRDHGKVAATFYHRGKGKAVRLCLNPGATDTGEIAEAKERPEGKAEVAGMILSMSAEELFKEQEVPPPGIPEAQIYGSVVCDGCGEAAMETRIVEMEGKHYCIPCSEKSQ
jgi:formylmethanofuran dehydrogenase subunit E